MSGGSGETAAPLLVCHDVTKTFGRTVALDAVSLTVAAGAVHALVGENGAGKSTLGRIIAGALRPDAGTLELNGARVMFRSPREALDHGVAFVAQELALVPGLTVAQNVFLGVEPRRAGFVRRMALDRQYRALASDVGFDLPGDALVGTLPVGQQQQVEILRALARDARLIVLDEPTAALSRPEAERLHDTIRALVARRRTVILVSHFLGEVLDLANNVTVLRDGRVVRTRAAHDETEASLIAAMLGRTTAQTFPDRRPPAPGAPVVLSVRDVVAPGVRGVSFELRAGEILGLGGLMGAGRSEVAQAVFGAVVRSAGTVDLGGGGRGHLDDPAGSLRAGMAYIPESRKDQGLMLGRPVRENVTLPWLRVRARSLLVPRSAERSVAARSLARCAVRTALDQPAGALSGGNQQKLLFARSILVDPRVLIADEPTRGVDVGAKRAIYDLIAALAADGTGVILISSELEELLGLAHRVLVMRKGRIVAELAGDGLTEASVLHAAFGEQAA